MATIAEAARPTSRPRVKRSMLAKALGNSEFWRGLVALILFILLWEIGSRWKEFFGYSLPCVGLLPAPSEVAVAWTKVLPNAGYWQSWYMSFQRVLAGSSPAMLIGIPFGLMLAVSRTSAISSSRRSKCCGRSRRWPGCRRRSSSGRRRRCRSRS